MKNECLNNEITITPQEIAKTAGITLDMARKYLSGYSLPRLDKAIRLYEVYNIPIEKWLELKEKRKESKSA